MFFSTAIFSFAALHLHVLNLFNHLVLWHDVDSLNQVKFLALGVSTLSTVGTIVFGALAFLMTNGEGSVMRVPNDSIYIHIHISDIITTNRSR